VTEHIKPQPKLRKKLPIRKKILLVISVFVLALVATVAVAYLRYLHPTGEIMSNLYAIRNDRNGIPMVNFFLLQVGEKYIVIDTGSDSIQTENELQKLGISANDVVALLLTHSDWDHVGSLHLFHNATLYTGDTEFQYAEASRFAPAFELPDIPHQIMADGEIIELYGRTIQCIYTPGHTSDSVCFLIDGEYLFVGDLYVTPDLARYDKELQILYREKMLGIDGVEYIFTGHFGLFKDVGFFRWWWL